MRCIVFITYIYVLLYHWKKITKITIYDNEFQFQFHTAFVFRVDLQAFLGPTCTSSSFKCIVFHLCRPHAYASISHILCKPEVLLRGIYNRLKIQLQSFVLPPLKPVHYSPPHYTPPTPIPSFIHHLLSSRVIFIKL